MTGSITTLLIASLLFVGGHVIMAGPPVRDAIVGRLGERPYLGLFSLISAALFVWMVLAWRDAPYIELWVAGGILTRLPLVLMPVAFILLICGNFAANPMAVMQDGRMGGEDPARGIIKVTRHPVMWAIVLWAGSHIAANGDLAAVIFMGALLVLAVVGMGRIEAKKRARSGDDWARFAAVTSRVPFVALVQGRTKLKLAELGWWKVGLGLALYVLFFAGHGWLIGVSPVPG
jgi:uncharacterized membrane protein